MKWVILIVTLMVGGMLFYQLMRGPQAKPGTPRATAQQFMEAAIKNDVSKAEALCDPQSVGDVARIVDQVQGYAPTTLELKYRPMSTDPPKQGQMIQFKGQMLGMEMIQDDSDQWKITHLGFN